MSKHALIWDLPLRIFHWLFSCTVIASWYTSDQDNNLIELHMQLGFFALGLLVFRILWGFLGTKHSLFSSFFPTPKRLIKYISDIKNKQVQKSSGHNPLGSLMVILMIVLISLQAISGLFINDDVFSSGPYYDSVSKEVEQVMVFLHHNVFDFMIAAIGLHLLAIVYYVHVKKQSLILPMITGKKLTDKINKADEITHSKLWLALIILLVVVAFVYWLVVLNAPAIEEYYY
ncbi:cytochrome b/b6 domain-containing protein [Colwellia hornerae]|uniref:Cytochrome B n=1 Tax=Colwellia hornerae TaxID=89402 RepID=A0A5C6Q3T5_9GAMM|nr:cytochrome b/b6 domain-containing protein [Colwellia hornerae]TWX47419.1 cytochrome B [Colwellia hornerae]TWX54699.1 cytochrome B [Colwellia hornerae]TWX63412.1 cytochrome B [Colwellia hornerae]